MLKKNKSFLIQKSNKYIYLKFKLFNKNLIISDINKVLKYFIKLNFNLKINKLMFLVRLFIKKLYTLNLKLNINIYSSWYMKRL